MYDSIKCEYCSFDGGYGHTRCSKNYKVKTFTLDKEYRYKTSIRCWWLRRLFCGYKD